MTVELILSETLYSQKNVLFGIADLEGLLNKEHADYKAGIAILHRLDDKIIDGISEGPSEDYYQHYSDINNKLAAYVSDISFLLSENGHPNKPVQPTFFDHELDNDYQRTLRTPVSHKMTATRAGLGWIGKTDLFISERWGPRVRLASILLKDKPERSFSPVSESKCGNCRICINFCPAKAATGTLWNVSIDRDLFFDAHKCRSSCREITMEKLNRELSICGICISVCPKGKNNGKY